MPSVSQACLALSSRSTAAGAILDELDMPRASATSIPTNLARPGNPAFGQITRRGVLNRPDVYEMLVRIELEGLHSCTPARPCGPLWPCERCAVQDELGLRVDASRPSAAAIACALRLEAELRDYLGADRYERIHAASDEQFLSQQEQTRLVPSKQQELASIRRYRELAIAHQAEESEIAAAAWESLVARQCLPDFTDEEASSLQALHQWQRDGGRPPSLPTRIEALGKRLVTQRMKRERGELPRSRRVSRTNRHRHRTGYAPSFATQLGRLRNETDPNEIKRLIRELRREARNLGLLSRPYRHRHSRHRARPHAPLHHFDVPPAGRMLIRAARGHEREARELSRLRAYPELAPDDPRRPAMEERFHDLADKQRRRTAFTRPLLRAVWPAH